MAQKFDYIIVGGGSSGCVLAHRLSEDENVSVCLLEAGGSHKNLLITVPMAMIVSIPRKIKNWAYHTVAQKGLNGRHGYQPRGKALGGSSVLNAMIYTRGHKSDYNAWAALGNKGWAYDDILPYFKKSQHREAGGDEYHGQNGLLNVAPITDPSSINDTFIEAAQQMQHPICTDFNGAELEGVGLFEVTQKNGQRWSTAHAFLDSAKHRKNLTIITHAQTEKVIIENGRATGVYFSQKGLRQQIHATQEVILSAGAFGSPQLLLLSGVGAKHKLTPHGIDQVHELAGVGENLQDHIDWVASYKSHSLETVGFSMRGFANMAVHAQKYLTKRRGMFATNYAESGGFLFTDKQQTAPDIQLHFTRAIVDEHGKKLHWGHGYSCHVCVLRPKSRGNVSLFSADPSAPPSIDPNFLADEQDMKTLYKGAKILQGILTAPAFDGIRGEPIYGTELQDEALLKADIRDHADTVYHPVGTCKMGHDDMAVVDDRLRVHGIKGLRVIDASIMPNIISGNTNAPCIMIAEKGADMIKQDAAAQA